MLTRLLGLDEGPISHLEPYLRVGWPRVIIGLLILAAIAYAVALYRRERTLAVRRRVLLGALRALLYVAVIVLLFEPTLAVEMKVKLRRNLLVLLDLSESMAIVDARTRPADVTAAAQALGKAPFARAGEAEPGAAATRPAARPVVLGEQARRAAVAAKRVDLAKGLLDNPHLDLFGRLSEDYNIRYFAFGERLRPTKGKGEVLPETLRRASAGDKATRLGTAVADAVGRFGGQPIAGCVLLTDGASNDGLEPLEVARRMKDQNIPLFPVGIGLPHPPDVRLRGPIVAETVFVGDRVPVRVQIGATPNYRGQAVTLSASLDGVELDRRRVLLDAPTRYVELSFEPEVKADAARLKVSVSALAGETSLANNTVSKTVRVIDEKIKVIYVEGKPRWEYRYLRRVLLRDHRLEVRFLMTEGDRDLAKHSELNIAEFPVDAAEAFDYDLVVLGDVPSSYFSRMQLNRIAELVRQRKGSLLMLAGFEHAPASYISTPLEPLLPVRLNAEGWRKVAEAVCPEVTEAGRRSALTTLEVPEEANARLWSGVRPMYRLPAVDGVKGGAVVLVTTSSPQLTGEPYPLISWQRYGNGKTMLVATDQLWRLRFKRGDKYHARLWGQAIQFLTLSRLLGGNRRVQLEIERTSYRQGEQVAVTANVIDEAYEPVKAASYAVLVRALGAAAAPRKLQLEPVPALPGMFKGYFTPQKPGRYEIRAPQADPKLANTVTFDVTAASLEQREPAMQAELLRKMAELSGGRYFDIADLPQLPRTVAGEQRTVIVRRDRELWDLGILFVALLALAGTEWLLRRKYDLI